MTRKLISTSSNEYLEHILQSVADVIIVLDLEKLITHLFGKNIVIYKWEQTAIIGKPISSIMSTSDIEKCDVLLDKVLQGATVEHEWELIIDSDTYSLQTTFSPLKGEKDVIIGIVGTTCDITDKHTADETKDLILGTASHELKNNLTSIKAYTQLLQKHVEKVKDEKSAFFLSKLDGKIHSINSLIQDMLDMTKLRTNKLTLRKEECDIDGFIEEIIEEMSQLTKKHTIIKKGLVDKKICIDGLRIEQVLSNMIRNAIKYSPEADKIYVWIEKNDKEVIIKVQDFGMGIPPEKQAEIFEPFTRINDPTKPRIPGFGLGLYISAEIVKLHGGRIWVESAAEQGSIFAFSIPQ